MTRDHYAIAASTFNMLEAPPQIRRRDASMAMCPADSGSMHERWRLLAVRPVWLAEKSVVALRRGADKVGASLRRPA